LNYFLCIIYVKEYIVSEYNKHNKVVFLTQYHFIWTSKYRRKILTDEVKNRLEQIIKDVACETQADIKAMEVMPDHVHLFASLHYKLAPYKFIKLIKGRSSNFLRKEFPSVKTRLPTLWSRSFFVASVGSLSEDSVKEYIETQWERK